MIANPDSLGRFSAATRQWFTETLGEPTAVQVAAWQQIDQGDHCLVIAPTGSGKTLAAFLHSLDRAMRPQAEQSTPIGVKTLYISPLKALGADVERNLRRPIAGIADQALLGGATVTVPSVGVRSGDTSTSQRRSMVIHPPDILITTPESLFLMLSSAAAQTLRQVETIIVDEVHYLVGNKRGAHLAVSLERLDAINLRGVPQRIGLSATVAPPEVAAGLLGGRNKQVSIVEPISAKRFDLEVRLAVDDLTALNRIGGEERPEGHTGAMAVGHGASRSIWPDVEQTILELILAHRSTICFCNSRATAEKLTNHLNALYRQSCPEESLVTKDLVQAHHGSVSKERRRVIEDDLKAGRLRAVVATSSLELGIDMGAVDLVIQTGAPPSVASGLQRIGRGGHQVGAISQGVMLPLSRNELLTTVAAAQLMDQRIIETTGRISNPLDVLAQQLVSMLLAAPLSPQRLFELVCGADCFKDLPRRWFDDVVDMLTGKYPSEDFAEFRPRLSWDRDSGMLSARPGARRLVTTSGGTIPDRGLYGVFMVADPGEPSSRSSSRRVGELDEEMVYESKVGDIFTLGTSAWRIEEITDSQVLVAPAPGQTGRLPFWHSDEGSRSVELGQAVQALVTKIASGDDWSVASDQLHLDDRASHNLATYVAQQRQATTVLPDASTIVVEQTHDDTHGWRILIHCQLGRSVLMPWAMLIQRRWRESRSLSVSVDPQVLVSDDGITIALGEVDHPSFGQYLRLDPADLETIIAQELQHSALFTAHFRHCAARALLMPRRDPGKRTPLWQQRLRGSQLLAVAASYPDFPIVAEALRECLTDVFDLTSLRRLLQGITDGLIDIVEVDTDRPSPFAAAMLFGYTGAFMYDYDAPLAERLVAASWVDPDVLAQLLGQIDHQLLDEATVAQIEAELQRLTPGRRASGAEPLWDLLRQLGPLTVEELQARSTGDAVTWLGQLRSGGRLADVTIEGRTMIMVSHDASLLSPQADLGSRQRLARRWLDHHVVTLPVDLAARYGWPLEQSQALLASLTGERVRSGRYLDLPGPQYATSDNLDRVRRRRLRSLRASVSPVSPQSYANFALHWAGVDQPGWGRDSLLEAIESLAGYPLPASMLESVILPARVTDYQPALLDQLVAEGVVRWTGTGRLGDVDGRIALWPADLPDLIESATPELSGLAQDLYQSLRQGGAWRVSDLALFNEQGDPQTDSAKEEAIWELVWAGLVVSDSFAAVRARLADGGVLRRPHTPTPRRLRRRPSVLPASPAPYRWLAISAGQVDPMSRLVAACNVELDRYGVLAKPMIVTEAMTPNYLAAYRVLSALEDQGIIRRGLVVQGLGAAQFALPGVVDQIRQPVNTGLVLLAATDPANPYGAALPWPETVGPKPSRKAGALLVLDDGRPVIHLDRGGHSLLTFRDDAVGLEQAFTQLGRSIDAGRIGEITITRINGQSIYQQPDLLRALESSGFVLTPQGCRRRRAVS
ncbi:MAG: DEAD/DEAH box helicase [Propionibacteriaceae bacterium]|jgi:ATP-dependent Lhr-like helicase|nr:DEAD/DEAH box helicase [Propionibacteriaceae bacterium]